MLIALTTTTTTTTTTTATTATALGVSQAAIYGALSVVILILLLIAKELLSSYVDETEGVEAEEGGGMMMNTKAKSLAANLSTAIYPLLFGFSLIMVIKVLEVL